ncbi:hypothetical protein AB0M43_01855 [Longispora sp. NPDC051575]|uniref:hypothetical protein n=1 Tax=Longispora sp. NPDC051575 TaxID=3154943 RepID=UPI003437F26E
MRRFVPQAVKVAVAVAAGGFLAASIATAKPPRPAAEPPAVKEVTIPEQQARELTRLIDQARTSPTPAPVPAPTRSTPGPRPTPPPPGPTDDPDLPVDEDEDPLPE